MQLLAVALLFAAFTIFGSNFWSQGNWLNTSVYGSTTLILALGETLVIITAGIDLSVGAVLGVASAVCGVYLAKGTGAGASHGELVVAVVLGLLAGAGCGLVNGIVIARLGVTPFIATLGMLGVGTGVTLLITKGISVTVPSVIAPLGNTVWVSWLPIQLAVALVLAVGVYYVLRYTKFGLHTYAIGSDGEAARRMGIATDRHLMVVYTVSGLLAGVAGVLTVAEFVVASPNAGGEKILLNAIAATVIGGVSLFGGRGSVGGTVIGAVIITSLVTGLVLMGVTPYWQTIAVGIVIVLAVYVQGFGVSRGRRARRFAPRTQQER